MYWPGLRQVSHLLPRLIPGLVMDKGPETVIGYRYWSHPEDQSTCGTAFDTASSTTSRGLGTHDFTNNQYVTKLRVGDTQNVKKVTWRGSHQYTMNVFTTHTQYLNPLWLISLYYLLHTTFLALYCTYLYCFPASVGIFMAWCFF